MAVLLCVISSPPWAPLLCHFLQRFVYPWLWWILSVLLQDQKIKMPSWYSRQVCFGCQKCAFLAHYPSWEKWTIYYGQKHFLALFFTVHRSVEEGEEQLVETGFSFSAAIWEGQVEFFMTAFALPPLYFSTVEPGVELLKAQHSCTAVPVLCLDHLYGCLCRKSCMTELDKSSSN